MKTLLLSAFATFIFQSIAQHTLDWAYALDQQSGGSSSISIATDFQGNIVTVGTFEGQIDADPGLGSIPLSSNGVDMILKKLDPQGNLIWVKRFEGSVRPFSVSVTTDLLGNIILCGRMGSVLDTDPGTGTEVFNSISNWDGFVIKLDSDGNFIWSQHFATSTNNEVVCQNLVTGSNNEIYLVGDFEGTVEFGTSGTTLSANSQSNFVMRINANGSIEWINRYGLNTNNFCRAVTLRSNGNVLVGMNITGSATLTSGTVVTALNNRDAFAVELDTDGNYVHHLQFQGDNDVTLQSVNEDYQGNLYLTGDFTGTVDFNPGTGVNEIQVEGVTDGFALKMINDSLAWVKTFPAFNSSYQLTRPLTSVVDGYNNLYIGGGFSGTVDFDPGPDSIIYNAPTEVDGFILQLSPDGHYLWSTRMWAGAISSYYSLALNDNNDLFTTGVFRLQMDLDPGSVSQIVTSSQDRFFIQKLNPPAVLSVSEISESSVSVYPNPSDGFINVAFDSLQESVRYEIYQLNGEIVDSGELRNAQEAYLELPERTGIYLLKLYFDDNLKHFKIVRE